MAPRSAPASPAGRTSREASSDRARRSPAYRAQQEERDPFRKLAWLLIRHRMRCGLTQQQLADKVGTSNTQISRIESGRHRTNIDTIARIAHALDLKMVVGFESTSESGRATRQVVTL